MPQDAAPASGENHAPEVMNFDQAAEAALAESEQAAGQQETQTQEAPAEGQTTAEGAVPEVPEHVRWAKAASGNTDEQGNLVAEKLAKQAFELNRQFQLNAQKLAQLDRLLAHPKMRAAMEEIHGAPKSRETGTETEGEKTDEQILKEFVQKTVDETTKDLRERAAFAHQRAINAEIELTTRKLHEEFGRDQYESIKEDIGRQMAVSAQQAGITPVQLVNFLIEKDQLFPVLQQAAQSLLYPKLKEQVRRTAETADKQKIEEKKRTTVVTAKGTSAASVSKAQPEINDFWSAAEAAEKELADKRK